MQFGKFYWQNNSTAFGEIGPPKTRNPGQMLWCATCRTCIPKNEGARALVASGRYQSYSSLGDAVLSAFEDLMNFTENLNLNMTADSLRNLLKALGETKLPTLASAEYNAVSKGWT